ncbi:MAG: GAF domain-containing protein, partial [Gammaproteobacteria bacterium]|nr:GAF domain-containing protein [Gammaproteobacteria bacterium]
MIEPPTPVDELLRLETLRNLKILDTDPEERFDRVTRLAKRIFGTPIALVSLVDNDRQWFKSCQGLDVTQTSREVSFCGHAILDDQPLVVNDAHFDARFSDNPLVTHEPNIRFYAGYPLRAPDGKKVGALCIIDSEPREMTADDLELLQELGQMVEEELATANLMHTDPVTGLSNGVGFGLIAKHILAMCKRTNTSASLMLFHLTNQQLIDGFIGNEEGDRASIELAQFLMASFRDSDIVARIAKDAFATLLVGSNLSEMETAQQRLAERLETRNLSTDLDYQLEIES